MEERESLELFNQFLEGFSKEELEKMKEENPEQYKFLIELIEWSQ